eukprot:g4058.t1
MFAQKQVKTKAALCINKTRSFFQPPKKIFTPRMAIVLKTAKGRLDSNAKDTKLGANKDNVETLLCAAGCFWGVELAFQRVPGVISTSVGYCGGANKNPTYEMVCSGSTGHTEACQVIFDNSIVEYGELLDILWDIHDPTTLNRQGNDIGTQYRAGVYYYNEKQHAVALESFEREQKSYDNKIVTELLPAPEYFLAEAYHQQYLEKGGQCSLKGDTTAIRCYG